MQLKKLSNLEIFLTTLYALEIGINMRETGQGNCCMTFSGETLTYIYSTQRGYPCHTEGVILPKYSLVNRWVYHSYIQEYGGFKGS